MAQTKSTVKKKSTTKKKTTSKRATKGRPRRYTAATLQKKVDEYFKQTSNPGVIGLAVYLDVDRETVRTWKVENGPFSGIIKKAYDKVAAAHEERLADGKCTGSIFWLKAQGGWQDKQEVKVEHQGDISLSINIKGLDGADV